MSQQRSMLSTSLQALRVEGVRDAHFSLEELVSFAEVCFSGREFQQCSVIHFDACSCSGKRMMPGLPMEQRCLWQSLLKMQIRLDMLSLQLLYSPRIAAVRMAACSLSHVGAGDAVLCTIPFRPSAVRAQSSQVNRCCP